MKPFKLKKTVQCKKCPWLVGTDPNEIPNGYDKKDHEELKKTIATDSPMEQLAQIKKGEPLHVMACHESRKGEEVYCVGWLYNQMQNNNIRLRIEMVDCENYHELKLVGEQHPTFEDTLPD